MARLPYLSPTDAEPRVRDMLERAPALGIFRMLANAQGAFVDHMRFGTRLLDEREFDPVLRELAILQVATLTPGAEYEWIQHLAIGRAVGVTDAQIEALETGQSGADVLGEDGRLVVGFTTQVVHDARPDDATFAAMTARFSTREIVHLLLVIGQYMMLGRVMATAQIDLDPAMGEDVLRGLRDAQR